MGVTGWCWVILTLPVPTPDITRPRDPASTRPTRTGHYLGVRQDGCAGIIWKGRRHGREGWKGRGCGSNGTCGLLLLLVCGYPFSHSSGVGSATIFGNMVAGMTLVATDLSFPWIWAVMHWGCRDLA